MKKGSITYLDDVIDELSEELKMDRREIEELCKLSIEYIKYLLEQKETVSVLIPFIGTLYFNRSFGRFYYNRLSKGRNAEKEGTKKDIETIAYRLEKIGDNKRHKKKPLLYFYNNILKKLGERSVRHGASVGRNELWTRLAEIQNEINSK